jgi:hypothetical protein
MNCGIDSENIYSNQSLNSNFPIVKLPKNVFVDSNVYETLYSYGKTSFFQKVKTYFKILIVILRVMFENITK